MILYNSFSILTFCNLEEQNDVSCQNYVFRKYLNYREPVVKSNQLLYRKPKLSLQFYFGQMLKWYCCKSGIFKILCH